MKLLNKLGIFALLTVAALPALAQTNSDKSWEASQVEVTIPTVVEAGREFPVIYRATPATGVRLEASFATKSKEGKLGQGRITDEALTVSHRIRKAVIDETGYYLLTFQFKNGSDKIIRSTARTKVISSSDYATLYLGKAWDWPVKNMYLAPAPFDSWSQAPPETREQMGLKRWGFSALLEQPAYDNSWHPLRAWNELHEVLQPQFVPPLTLITAFENASSLPIHHVAYATWTQDETNFLYQGNIGGAAWFYIETPAAKAAADLKTIFQPQFLKPSMKPAGETASGRTLLSRQLTRYRALSLDAPAEKVQVWLVQMLPHQNLNLRFPGYRAPELPRIPASQ